MKVLSLVQGTPEWLAHRRATHNASDAPAMMGASPYVKRADLVRQRATGIEREIDATTQAIFDRGHEVEPKLRALTESIIGEELYPVTAVSDDGYLGASFDGVNISETIIFEAKQSNAAKEATVMGGSIPVADYWQIVQQFAVCETAERCYYSVGDGETVADMLIRRVDVDHDIPNLRAGWKQFDADVAAYIPAEKPEAPITGRAPETLPVLRVEAQGMVTFSNLAEFRSNAMAVLGAINRDLQTDEDFADAETTVKWCKGVEDRLEAAKSNVLAQMQSVDEVCRTIDTVNAETRKVRLELDRLVKTEKEHRRAELVANGVAAVRAHYDSVSATLGEHGLGIPATLTSDIGSAIKGKKSLTSMRDAIDTAVAAAKIDASQRADRIRANIAVLGGFKDHAHLFADRVQLCATKAPEDLRNLATARVAEHKQREAERLEAERARIRQEEAARIDREQQAAQAAQQPNNPPKGNEARAAAEPPSLKVDAARKSTGATIKLGDINACIAPLSITAAGLATLGFTPVGSSGAAKLYAESDLPAIYSAMSAAINRVARDYRMAS